MKKIKKGLFLLLILLSTSVVFAVEPDNKLPESDSITITWNLSNSGDDKFDGQYSLKFIDQNDADLTELPLQTSSVQDGTLKGTGTCYLEWEFFTPVAVEVSVYSSKLQGTVSVDSGTQFLDWYADITQEAESSLNALFESPASIGGAGESAEYGSETAPVPVFTYDPANGLKDSGKAKFTITTEDASLLKPDSFTTTLTAVVKAKESSSLSI